MRAYPDNELGKLYVEFSDSLLITTELQKDFVKIISGQELARASVIAIQNLANTARFAEIARARLYRGVSNLAQGLMIANENSLAANIYASLYRGLRATDALENVKATLRAAWNKATEGTPTLLLAQRQSWDFNLEFHRRVGISNAPVIQYSDLANVVTGRTFLPELALID